MRIVFVDGSPDGMHLKYIGYVMDWQEAKDFLDWISLWESKQYKEILKTISQEETRGN